MPRLLLALALAAAAQSWRERAQDAMSRGDDRAAAESAAQAVLEDPKDARAYNILAIAHQHLGDYAAELEDVERGLRAAPGDAPLLKSKATALNRLRRHREALEAADAAVAADDGYYGHLMRAQALDGLGERVGALAALRRAAELNPGLYDKLQAALKTPPERVLGPEFFRSPAPEPRSDPWLPAAVLAAAVLGSLAYARRREPPPPPPMPPAPPTPDYATPMPGLLKGQYRTGRRIGTGGMGVVHEGVDVSLERRVAIKRMKEEIRIDPRERERFLTEARLVATLHHPHIVDIYSIVEEGPEVYLVFEFVPGRNVYELLAERKTLPLPEALKIARGVAAALDYAHGRGVIHRDLKPSNIMLSEEGNPKVMDFGVARQAKDATIKVMTGTIVGTPPYMAPEQEEGHVRRESDVFSLAVCLYEMLSGRLPFEGAGAAMQQAKKDRRFVPVSSLVPGLPSGLDAVLAKGLEPDPDARWRRARDFVGELDWLL